MFASLHSLETSSGGSVANIDSLCRAAAYPEHNISQSLFQMDGENDQYSDVAADTCGFWDATRNTDTHVPGRKNFLKSKKKSSRQY